MTTAWLLVAVIVLSTTSGDILQSLEMRKQGGATVSNTALSLFRRPLLVMSVVCMAASFFAFTVLLSISDLSFAVPATAASYVMETILARLILREQVDWRRWTGALLVAGGVALLAA